jgi:hypothetical protein
MWLTWSGAAAVGGAGGQHVFDFGSQAGTGANAVGRTYVFLEPSSRVGGPMSAGFRGAIGSQAFVNASSGALPVGVVEQVAVVVDDAAGTLALYLNGMPVGVSPITGSLAGIDGENAWLGRSQFADNPEFHGLLHEFRIYSIALTASQVAASFAAGADPAYLP